LPAGGRVPARQRVHHRAGAGLHRPRADPRRAAVLLVLDEGRETRTGGRRTTERPWARASAFAETLRRTVALAKGVSAGIRDTSAESRPLTPGCDRDRQSPMIQRLPVVTRSAALSNPRNRSLD